LTEIKNERLEQPFDAVNAGVEKADLQREKATCAAISERVERHTQMRSLP
jgi:hypothetical protein